MSKFNGMATGNHQIPANRVTTTHNGGVGYTMDAKAKLMTQVMTCFFGEPKFYGGQQHNNDIVKGIREMLEIDPKFVANLGVYTREVLHLRSVTHVIAAELAAHVKGKPFARAAISKIVERPDDMTEIFAYYMTLFGKPIPNSMKKGLGDAFKRFDEFSLQKYNGGARQAKEVKLKDIYLMCRPSPTNQEQYEMWRRMIANELATPVTWETQLATRGNTKEVWEELLQNNNVGYMAMLRNLRNIIQSKAGNVELAYEKLSNEQAVLRSKQLPFRFLTAYKMAQSEGWGNSKLLDVLDNAMKLSAQNIKKIPGKTFWAADASGSMSFQTISAKSIMRPSDIAITLMSMGNYISDESITSVFASTFKPWPVSAQGGILANAQSFNHVDVGASTNGHLPIQYLLENKIFVDRIVMLSDNQVNPCLRNAQSMLDEYRRKVNPNVWVHAVDLMGAGTQQFIGKNVNLITGWSEKVLDFIMLAEQGPQTMVNTIDTYYFK